MSRGFVKEDDQEEVPMVPPRADLPVGSTNYVTPTGMAALATEKKELIGERESLDTKNEKERRIALNHINAKLMLLNSRIMSAKVVELKNQPKDEVRFGAYVTLSIGNTKKVQTYQIVGVDEADISKAKISFVSPIAKLLTNKKRGDKAILKIAKESRIFEIVDIAYNE